MGNTSSGFHRSPVVLDSGNVSLNAENDLKPADLQQCCADFTACHITFKKAIEAHNVEAVEKFVKWKLASDQFRFKACRGLPACDEDIDSLFPDPNNSSHFNSVYLHVANLLETLECEQKTLEKSLVDIEKNEEKQDTDHIDSRLNEIRPALKDYLNIQGELDKLKNGHTEYLKLMLRLKRFEKDINKRVQEEHEHVVRKMRGMPVPRAQDKINLLQYAVKYLCEDIIDTYFAIVAIQEKMSFSEHCQQELYLNAFLYDGYGLFFKMLASALYRGNRVESFNIDNPRDALERIVKKFDDIHPGYIQCQAWLDHLKYDLINQQLKKVTIQKALSANGIKPKDLHHKLEEIVKEGNNVLQHSGQSVDHGHFLQTLQLVNSIFDNLANKQLDAAAHQATNLLETLKHLPGGRALFGKQYAAAFGFIFSLLTAIAGIVLIVLSAVIKSISLAPLGVAMIPVGILLAFFLWEAQALVSRPRNVGGSLSNLSQMVLVSWDNKRNQESGIESSNDVALNSLSGQDEGQPELGDSNTAKQHMR